MELRRSRRLQDSPAALDNAAHIASREPHALSAEQPIEALADANDFNVFEVGRADDSAQAGIHPRRVPAGSQNADSIHWA